MLNRKIIVLTIIFTCLLAVSAVSAADNMTGDVVSADETDEICIAEDQQLEQNDIKEFIGVSDDGTFTALQNRIDAAEEGSTVTLENDYLYNDDFNNASGIKISKSLTIDGNGYTIDANKKSRIFNVTASNVTIKDITFINGDGSQGGAVYFSGSTGNIMNCNFINNTAVKSGGAVYFDLYSTGMVANCNFTKNKVTKFNGMGGAICFNGESTDNVTACSFTDNYAEYNGGALYFFSNAHVTGCNFINNTAKFNGGAIIMNNGSVENCNFINNKGGDTGSMGGSIFILSDSIANVVACNFINSTAVSGGAVYFDESSFGEIRGCNFTNNRAIGNSGLGGALFVFDSANVVACNFINNSATNGGAIDITSGYVTACNFTDNKASESGGAIWVVLDSNINISDSVFTNNIANESGGAVYFDDAFSNAEINSTFINNSAKNGGAIYFYDEINNVTINGCFKDNEAVRAGGAIFVRGQSRGNDFSSEFYDNRAGKASGGAIFFSSLAESNTFEGVFVDNYALYGGAMFFYKKANGNKFGSEFIDNTAKSCGGAMFFYNTTDGNNFSGCFISNHALGEVDESVGNGGAITFKNTSSNSIFTCDFVNNTAALNGGGVNYRQTPYNITFNSNFINNTSPSGGGVNFFETFENVIFNGEFIANSATNGGAIAAGSGSIKDVSFMNNSAENGGAIYFAESAGEIVNCIFVDNSVSSRGGAVYFYGEGDVVDSSFINNMATGNDSYGGAVYLNNVSNVVNCNFKNNTALVHGGAVDIYSGSVLNCTFVDNSVSSMGGAVYFYGEGAVVNCNFNGNEANIGSALYLYGCETAKVSTISHSSFLNNKANVEYEPFESTMNGSNLEITFVGNDNLLNAIYSRNEVNLTNVTYWGANGIENTGVSTINPSRSNKEAGQNITVKGFVNGNVIDMVKVTDADGKIVLEDVNGYYIIVRHDDDFYYKEAEEIFANNQSNNVTVIVDGVEYSAELVNGTVTVETNKTEPVVKKDTIIEVESAFTRVANDYYANERGAFFYAVLKDTDGNILANRNVSIAVNGPIYNVTTDDQGRAGLQVNFMIANVYTYALSFKGDDEYNAAPMASSKLTVTKKSISISASAKSFKAKAKKTISVTLKAAKNPYDGKVYLKSGKKVTLKVNGKTYTAKANAKGVAKFTIKLTKKGKYTAKIKFAGDKTYKSASKNIKITIK